MLKLLCSSLDIIIIMSEFATHSMVLHLVLRVVWFQMQCLVEKERYYKFDLPRLVYLVCISQIFTCNPLFIFYLRAHRFYILLSDKYILTITLFQIYIIYCIIHITYYHLLFTWYLLLFTHHSLFFYIYPFTVREKKISLTE